MSALRINADTLFRAVTAHDFKVLAYYLDLRDGEITSKTLPPGELAEAPRGPSVAPLPVLGADVSVRKGDSPFGPVPVEKKVNLFGDEPHKKEEFKGDFWKRDTKNKADPFGGSGPRRENSARKLAELFGDKAASTPVPSAPQTPPPEQGEYVANLDLDQPLQRIPPARAEQQLEWFRTFARECGDPKIKDELSAALNGEKFMHAFERVLRKYPRSNQQWELYFRKQALHYAAAWLKALPIQWELFEPDLKK